MTYIESKDAEGEPIRLSKRLSELGLCSRREADDWISQGWVLVDGEVIDTLGYKVFRHQDIRLAHRAATGQNNKVTILYHKPVGIVSGQAEDGYINAATQISQSNRWVQDTSRLSFSKKQLIHLAPAGRLDSDSSGLLVLTQDGRIAKQLIGPESTTDKEYLVRVQGEMMPDGLKWLRFGLSLDGEPLRPAKVGWQNHDQLIFILNQGKKRQIRRMCELVGLQVIGLKRVRIGNVRLGALPRGQWRYLAEDESF